MRTITLLCTSFLLALCISAQPPQKKSPPKGSDKKGDMRMMTHPIDPNNDSTPIIISDGSIHVLHGTYTKDFSVKQIKHAEIQLPNYYPSKVGYLCDPSVYPKANPACSSPPACSKGANASMCTVDVSSAKSWNLSLCETAGTCPTGGGSTVEVNWKDTGKTKMTVDSHSHDFSYTKATANTGGELIHAGDAPLKSGTLEVKPQSGPAVYYNFTCSGQCFVVGYNCSTSGGC